MSKVISDTFAGISILIIAFVTRLSVLLTLWNYFIVPYTGFKQLTITAAVAIIILFNALVMKEWKMVMQVSMDDKIHAEYMIKRIFFCIFAIAIGWVLK